MIRQFIKKPVVIQAIQFKNGNLGEVLSFIGDDNLIDFSFNRIKIKTFEGAITATKNDFIIKGVHGEFYPCKPDIFKKTYDMIN